MVIKDQVLMVIRNQIAEISDKLEEAKIKFADCCLNEDEWQIRVKYEKMCKIYEGQIKILESLENTLERDVFVVVLPVNS